MDEQAPAPPDEHQQAAQQLKARVHALRHPAEGEQPPASAEDSTLAHPQVAAFIESTGADVLGRFVALVRSQPDPAAAPVPEQPPPAAPAPAPANPPAAPAG